MNMGINVKTAGAGGPAPTFAELGKGAKTETSGFADVFDKALKESRKAAQDRNHVSGGKDETSEQPVKKQDQSENTDKAQKTQNDKNAQNTEDASGEDRKTEPKGETNETNVLLADLAMQLVDIPVEMPVEPENAETEAAPITASALGEGQVMDMQPVPGNQQTAIESPAMRETYASMPQNQAAAGEALKEAEPAGGRSQAPVERQPESVKASETAEPKIQAQQPKAEADGGEDTFSNLLKGHAEQLEAMGSKKAAAPEVTEKSDQEQENQALEELRRNADGRGVDLTERLAAKQSVYKHGPVMNNADSDLQTPVAQQLKAGLEQGIKRDLQEFTIRLKPEGLGEIVVHMASAGGRTTVSLAVSNPETEKLVNSQMMSLKEMLEPLHAEVEAVYHNSQGGMEFAGSGQEMFRNQGRQAQAQTRGRGGTGRQQVMETDMIRQETERMTAQSSLRRLYAYV